MNFDIVKLDESNNRRVFYIDIGNVSKEQIEKIIKELVDSKKIPINIGIFYMYLKVNLMLRIIWTMTYIIQENISLL